MSKKIVLEQYKHPPNLHFRLVFFSTLAKLVVFVLLASFVLQPIERIYAAEAEATPVVSETIDTSSAGENVPAAPVEIFTPPSETSAGTDSNDNSAPEEVTPESADNATSTTDDVLDESVVSDEIIEDTIAEYTVDELATTSATSTAALENPVAVSTVQSDDVVQFNKADCVAVPDGSFYCKKQTSLTELAADGLFSLPDIDGDLEIYYRQNGEMTQLTFNTVDDAAPFYDPLSKTIVWHRLIDDRYQIMSMNTEDRVESQLTTGGVNNMEPSRSGQYTVWQNWRNNNWDIMLATDGEVILLTDTLTHDIAPKIRGNLVIWNSVAEGGTQTIELYDIVTKEYTTINDKDGGALSNPRMVLVYESEFANGDVVTKGYDVVTGEITPLSTLPADIPAELPDPDNTGETRALIQGKAGSKDDIEIADNSGPQPYSGDGPPVPSIASTTATTPDFASTTTSLTLDLTQPIATIEPPVVDITIPPFTSSTEN